ncbi:MAG TPA: hypothetical protein VK508_12720 [Cyclobacteriaceae bacterium]|nr:hypothetical protein [Cyclobacteriaceae bacterium]
MIAEIRRKLIELARSKSTWSYSQLNDQLDLKLEFGKRVYDRILIGDWLEEVSIHEFERNRPLLSALIIHKGPDKEQGNGFYKLCEKLYNIPWQELKGKPDFEIEKIKECFSFWKDNENFRQYKDDYI